MPADHLRLRFSRRRFAQGASVVGLGLVAGCGRLPGPTQRDVLPPPIPRVGWLHNGLEDTYTRAQVDAFRQGLREYGYVEGQNILVEYRWADGALENLHAAAAELASLSVDVLVTQANPATQAAREVTSTIPIVMSSSVDPVGNRLIDTLARPGGNVTGVSVFMQGLPGKRLDLLKQAVPGITRVGVLWDATTATFALSDTQLAAEALALQVVPLDLHGPEDFDAAFEQAARAGVDAIFPLEHRIIIAYRPRVMELAATSRLPGMFTSRVWVEDGGLMAYGPNVLAQYRRAAYFVDRILKGAKPAELPVEQPREFEFVINRRTAQALGLAISQQLLLQATEVIQ